MSGVQSNGEKSWRRDAAAIVEDLFRMSPAAHWDLLLDLRQNILAGKDWNKTLDIFLACRERLENSQYLPFYRLRRLLAESLRLEAVSSRDQAYVASLKQVLRRQHRSLADIRRAFSREMFEHELDAAAHHRVALRVIER